MSDLQRPEWFHIERPEVSIIMRWYGHDYECGFSNTELVYFDEPYKELNHIRHWNPDNNFITFVFDVPEDMEALRLLHFDAKAPGIPDEDTVEIYIQWELWKAAELAGEQWGEA